MSKYKPLWNYLKTNGSPMLRLTFEEINVDSILSYVYAFAVYLFNQKMPKGIWEVRN